MQIATVGFFLGVNVKVPSQVEWRVNAVLMQGALVRHFAAMSGDLCEWRHCTRLLLYIEGIALCKLIAGLFFFKFTAL